MIAVVVLPGPNETMLGLDEHVPSALLPLGDRPVLQHIIEWLAAQRITTIELVIGHAPERVEALLGNGDRWGCSFHYHLAAREDRRYRSLRVIERTKHEPWVLIDAERCPVAIFPADPARLVIYRRAGVSDSHDAVVMPAGSWGESMADLSEDELRAHLLELTGRGEIDVEYVSEWIDVSSPAALLETQGRLLNRQLNGLMISGIERQPGIWISRNVVMHPSVELVPPIYIGPNSRISRGTRLGPSTVVSGHCIVDANTSVENSLVANGSYVGEGLELNQSIVNHNLLVNVRLAARAKLEENFLLGDLEPTWRQSWAGRATQSAAALALLLLFLPVLLISAIYFAVARQLRYTDVPAAKVPPGKNQLPVSDVRLPCLGEDAWRAYRPAGWEAFLRQFLPGLFAVLFGRINLVGLPPRSTSEILELPEDWRALYGEAHIGLITEASLSVADSCDHVQLYLADAYYTARRSWRHDLELTGKYLGRLIVPQREISV